MKKGFAIAFFVLAIITCVMMIGKPWNLVEEVLTGSVTDSTENETFALLEDRIYDIGGIEWVYIYSFDDKIEISIDGREYDPENFADFCQNTLEEVLLIFGDYYDLDRLGSIYISEYEESASINWYTDDGKRGYFSYVDEDGEVTSFDNITPEELKDVFTEEHWNKKPSIGGALG